MRCVVLLALLPLAGCITPGVGCEAPPGADASREPYDHGVVLHTVRDGTTVDAWACNDSGESRWLLVAEGGCPGSWTWTYTPPDAATSQARWPSETDYGACERWQRIPDGQDATQTMTLDVPNEPGGEWRIRLQVYTQPEIVEDAGGGPVHAVYVT